MNEWLMIAIMALPFLCLFVLSEWLYHKRKVPAEYTRKIVHIGTGLLTLLFPIVFAEWWQVSILCCLFLLVLLLSMRFHLLPSVNAIERQSWGSVLFPVIVMLVFHFYCFMQKKNTLFHSYLFFYLPVLVMALADPAAAFAGNYYKRFHPGVIGKTIVGSVVFFGASLLIICIAFILCLKSIKGIYFLYVFAISFETTVAERWSSKGWDNFTIPLSVMVLLYLMI